MGCCAVLLCAAATRWIGGGCVVLCLPVVRGWTIGGGLFVLSVCRHRWGHSVSLLSVERTQGDEVSGQSVICLLVGCAD